MMSHVFYNLGQNFVDKVMKLSKICVSVEWYTADLFQFYKETVKIYFSGDRFRIRYQF